MNAIASAPHRFLFTTWEGGGVVVAPLDLARQLMQRGHRVRFMCDESARGDAEAAGVEFVAWMRAPNRPDRSRHSDPLRDWESTGPQDGIRRVIERIMFGPARDYAQDLLAELEREPADLVVTNEMLFGVMTACESRRIPLAIYTTNLCVLPVAGMPAFGPGLPPPASDAERALHAEILAGTRAMFNDGLPALNVARRSVGLAEVGHIDAQLEAVSALLLGTSRAFDFPSTPPDWVEYVGPHLGEPGWAQSWRSPWTSADPRPLVVVAFSTTFQDHAGVLQRVVDALAQLPVRVALTLAGIEAAEVRPAANTVAVPSAPHDVLMREAAFVITHGGHGTVMRALSHRRPMLVIPHGRDQAENAIRVSLRGAGLTLSANATTVEIAAAARRLLDEPSFSEAAHALGRAVMHDARNSNVLERLESLAAGGRYVANDSSRISRHAGLRLPATASHAPIFGGS